MTKPLDDREPEQSPVLQMFGDADAAACDGDSCPIPEAPAEKI